MTGPFVGDGYCCPSLSEFGPLRSSPFAPAEYQFFRNVKDFSAVGDGVTNDTAAINRAASVFSQANQDEVRCDGDCGSITTPTAVVYFLLGTYLISIYPYVLNHKAAENHHFLTWPAATPATTPVQHRR